MSQTSLRQLEVGRNRRRYYDGVDRVRVHQLAGDGSRFHVGLEVLDRFQPVGPLVGDRHHATVLDFGEIPNQIGAPISTPDYTYIDHVLLISRVLALTVIG